jgi:hypothetical protein
MLQLTSKLQHNTYEKGEFSDEQSRNVDETIQLIKNFPWGCRKNAYRYPANRSLGYYSR